MTQSQKREVVLEGKALGPNIREASLENLPSFLADRVVGKTSIGQGRERNQDAASAFIYQIGEEKHLTLSVADGLGFYLHSDKSSFDAVTHIPRALANGEDVVGICRKTHEKLYSLYPYESRISDEAVEGHLPEDGAESKKEDRGATTLVLCDIVGDLLRVASIGDSRGYLIRKGRVAYQTEDQSMLTLLLRSGKIPDDRKILRRHPYRNVVLNALGSPEATYEFIENGKRVIRESGLPVVDEVRLEKGDFLFVATDGVFTNLVDDEIVQMISQSPWEGLGEKISDNLDSILSTHRTHLDEEANPDNYTFIVYRHL